MRSVGGYRLIRQIGCGGMSSVYEAVNDGGDRVALKLLHPSLAADEVSRTRLRREVNVLRRVRSPYVAEVVDAELDGVEPFIVTELVEGLTLEKDVQDNGIYTEEDLVRLGEQLRDALISVHNAGVLHRDLKPSNVMISEGKPILIDFGIAQAEDATRLTQQGGLALTPGYCDPRVIRGAAPDEAADWWAMAAVMAYAASGEPPFGQGSTPAVIRRVLQGEVSVPDVDSVILSAFRCALAADVTMRCSYDELLETIDNPEPERFVADDPTVFAEPSTFAAETPTFVTESPMFVTETPTLLFEESAALAVKTPVVSEDSEGVRLPEWAREPKKCRFLVFIVWCALVCCGAHWPAWMIIVTAVGIYVLDIVGTSMQAVRSRRLRHGDRRAGDGAVITLRMPLIVVSAALRTAVSVGIVTVLGLGIGWLAVKSMDRYGSQMENPAVWAAVAVLSATAALWFSPLSKRARLGARYMTGGASTSHTARTVWMIAAIMLLVIGIAVATTVGSVAGVSWQPFSDI